MYRCPHAFFAVLSILMSSPALADNSAAAWIDDLVGSPGTASQPVTAGRLPFSFAYAGKPSEKLLAVWKAEQSSSEETADAVRRTVCWDEPAGRLRVSCQLVHWKDDAAAEWMLWFENRGDADTEIVADVQAMDLIFSNPLPGQPWRLYRTRGGPACPADFEPYTVAVDKQHPQTATAGQGRSSHQDFPFFKLDTARGSAIIAVGWSGMWKAEFNSTDDHQLHATAGLEKTHFRLHPGEKVRSPRILILADCGDTWDANARFRRLIFKHYAARRAGAVDTRGLAAAPLPMLFCNTCFTRGGAWLNECNAANQISLIDAYAPLGLEALLTDAGWFEGGWPAGAGNWNPRKDAYPDGMGPVAAAAKARGMIYGLWFEPERVVAGTWLHKNRPQWLLKSQAANQDTYLLNFGLPEVQKYFFDIVKDFMVLPGFRFYRQDFNMDPLPYWRFHDATDRVGVTEMKYIEGLYAYWDSIARAWPDSVREECASGGNRIDLETVMRMRMHLHQKSDYWFDNETDQASLWSLSQYLPNNVVVAHLNRMDDYSFHSTLASSLCMGWIADDPSFDTARGKQLLSTYLAVRPLLVGDWYPLLPYSRDPQQWTGCQFHRCDLDEGMLLVFRHHASPYRTAELALHGVQPEQRYVLDACGMDGVRHATTYTGRELLRGIYVTLPSRPASDLLRYHRTRQ